MKKSDEKKKIKEETLLNSAFNLFTKKALKIRLFKILQKVQVLVKELFTYILKINMIFKID